MSNNIPAFLRPDQIDNYKEEIKTIERTLSSPHAQMKGEMRQRLARKKKDLETQTPTEFVNPDQKDAAVRRIAQLEEHMTTDGMPTQEEMRRNPPGAVAKHVNWENRNKQNLLEWKYLKRRLEPENNDIDYTNFERYRPNPTFGRQMAMEGAQIAKGREYFFPGGSDLPVVMTEEQSKTLKDVDPELHSQMLLMNAESRKEVLALVQQMIDNQPKRGRPKKEEEN